MTPRHVSDSKNLLAKFPGRGGELFDHKCGIFYSPNTDLDRNPSVSTGFIRGLVNPESIRTSFSGQYEIMGTFNLTNLSCTPASGAHAGAMG